MPNWEDCAMTLEEQLSTIPITTLIEYHKVGFKLVPVARDSRTPNIQGILTPEEEIRNREELSDGLLHPVFSRCYRILS